jgi:hypothetical protein
MKFCIRFILYANNGQLTSLCMCFAEIGAHNLTQMQFCPTPIITMDAATMRTAFTHLGCSLVAARAILDEQGINSVDELKIVTDTEIENLCKVVHRPGGQVANPNAAKAGQQPQLPNHGESISLQAKLNIKLAAYYVRHRLDLVSRDCNAVSITLAAIWVDGPQVEGTRRKL